MRQIHITADEFMALATFVMTNDKPADENVADMQVVHSVLDQVAINCLGYDDWVQAYHELQL